MGRGSGKSPILGQLLVSEKHPLPLVRICFLPNRSSHDPILSPSAKYCARSMPHDKIPSHESKAPNKTAGSRRTTFNNDPGTSFHLPPERLRYLVVGISEILLWRRCVGHLVFTFMWSPRHVIKSHLLAAVGYQGGLALGSSSGRSFL